jgi:hypothetical protein
MKQMMHAGLIAALAFGLTASAQDWYHDRDERFRGEHWRAQVFLQIRQDLEHIWSANRASDKERTRRRTWSAVDLIMATSMMLLTRWLSQGMTSACRRAIERF